MRRGPGVLLALVGCIVLAFAALDDEFATPKGGGGLGGLGKCSASDGSFSQAMREIMKETVLKAVGVGVAVFCCLTCNKQFDRACELGRHYSSARSSCVNGFSLGVAVTPRKSYTYLQKRDALLYYDELIREGHFNPAAVLAYRTGLPKACVSDWIRDRGQIFYLAGTEAYARKRRFRTSVGKHPEAEFQLYLRFVWRRQHLKRRVGYGWLRANMLDILATNGEVARLRGGNSWCRGFCKRWHITRQCRTNTKTTPIEERLPQIRAFHQYLIYGVQRSDPQRCPKYGRFPPRRMFHMDQVPLPFSPNSRMTLNVRGDQCVIADPGGDGGKRFATLQITICADPTAPPVDIEVYFRGTGLRADPEEEEYYRALPGVNVRWQPKAWADERIMLLWFRDFREQVLTSGEVLLGMDNHGSQATPLCKAFMEHFNIVPAYTPANCTDCISPVDHHVGQTIKQIIARKYEAAFDASGDGWDMPPEDGGLDAKEKRMLVATWVSEAWQEFTTGAKYHHLVRSAFVRTGFLVAKDGSENELIELHPVRVPAGSYEF